MFGAGALLSGAAALVSALRNGRKIDRTTEKVEHVAKQVATSNGHTLGELVEGNEARRLVEAASDDLAAPDGHSGGSLTAASGHDLTA
jgi:hypothetical protein